MINTELVYESACILQNECHSAAVKSGWWHDPRTGSPHFGRRDVPTMLMLIVSELAEAMEGHRKNKFDDHIPHMGSLTVELADALIRIFDMAGGMGYDLPQAIVEKLIYNSRRADHRPENRVKKNGKTY